ncbi:Uncharacterized protein Fot_27714 [Forsythia ovata]|uniref:Uncharacterized protein n=1 Tax=Forsythia ovata TaxID=205694 RepID=A0ABD1TMA0_9LAMI
MALEVQNQQPQSFQLVSGSGVAAAKMGCCHRCISIVLHCATPITLDLFSNSHHPPSPIELQEHSHLPLGWQKSLDIKLPHAAWLVGSLKPEVGATPTEPIDKVLLLVLPQ